MTSPRMAKLGWPEEVFYRRLHSVVDDFGRYYADQGMLRAACYPRQLNKVSDPDIGKWLRACVDAALVRVYPAQDGERYLEVLDFAQQVRAKKSKFPGPISTCAADATQETGKVTSNAPVFVGVDEDVDDNPPTPRQRGESSRFDEFWAAWPKSERKQDKAKCADHWKRNGLDAQADAILADIATKAKTTKWQEGFIEAPLVYLRGKRWEDGVTPDGGKPGEVAKPWHDSRLGIEDKGEELGLGRWDQDAFDHGRGEHWLAYQAKVFRAAGITPRAAA